MYKRQVWDDATLAFSEALAFADGLTANDSITLAARDNARAKVLLNLAQSHFHSSAFSEARQCAERSLAIRVALYGEDSLVVARTRSDLAVILGAMGDREEASSLLDRALSAVERKPGEQSAPLIPVLASAARMLASTADGRLDTDRVEARLDVLAKQHAADEAQDMFAPMPVPAHSFQNTAFASGSDDQPLRAAIAETANLLRTTPTSNIAVNINLDDAIFDLIEPPPPTLSSFPTTATRPPHTNPLGFEVQYGIPTQLHEPLQSADTLELPRSDAAAADTKPLDVLRAGETAQRATSRAPVRAVGGIRSGRTQVASPKLLWYMTLALIAFGAGVAITMIVLFLRR